MYFFGADRWVWLLAFAFCGVFFELIGGIYHGDVWSIIAVLPVGERMAIALSVGLLVSVVTLSVRSQPLDLFMIYWGCRRAQPWDRKSVV